MGNKGDKMRAAKMDNKGWYIEHIETNVSTDYETYQTLGSGSIKIPNFNGPLKVECTVVFTDPDIKINSLEDFESRLKDYPVVDGHRFTHQEVISALENTFPEYFV